MLCKIQQLKCCPHNNTMSTTSALDISIGRVLLSRRGLGDVVPARNEITQHIPTPTQFNFTTPYLYCFVSLLIVKSLLYEAK